MKHILGNLKSFFSIIVFCIKLSAKSSAFYFAIATLLNIVTAIIPMTLIYLSSSIINILVGAISVSNADTLYGKKFMFLLVALSLVSIFKVSIQNIHTYCTGIHREMMNKHIKDVFMKKATSLDLNFFDSANFYNSMNDANNNSNLIIQTAFDSMDFIRHIIQLLVAIFYLSNYSYIFAVIICASIIPQVILQKKQYQTLYSFQFKNMGYERKIQYLNNITSSRMYVKDVKLYNLYPFLQKRVDDIWSRLFKEKRNLTRKYAILLIATAFLPEIATTVLYLRLGFGVLTGLLDVGSYAYYQGIAGQVLGSMYVAVSNYGRLIDSRERIQNYLKFMNWENNMPYNGKEKIKEGDLKIEFKNVSFRYDKNLPLVLKNVSFAINPREKVALVGVNGSGKSSIIKLILRFYDPEDGIILVNDMDIREYDIMELRKKFSCMFQDYCCYAFTIRESVVLSDYALSDDGLLVEAAAMKSGIKSFTDKFPNKLDTYLTRQYDENGEELSGGQWQKVALARAFFRNAAIYILDEPSAALDAESEDELFQKFEELYADKSSILVSHRLSNVSSANKIFVIDDGRLIESGNHVELMKLGGKYFHLYTLQAKKYEITP